jgi:L-asparaginase
VRKITLITTGGTIEKTYDEQTGVLLNRRSIVRRMLSELRLEDTEVEVVELLSKDSLDMTDSDRERIVAAVKAACPASPTSTAAGHAVGASQTGIVVLHGTDTLAQTGERLWAALPSPSTAVVLTGAMRPFEMKLSDALQNLTEAIFATGVLAPGVYCVAHGRALAFPGVRKDYARGTFVLG